MDFRILGPLEVRDGDASLALGGAKQRLLLGVLLLHANEVVSSDRLIEALYGEDAPPTAAKALQMQVVQLRRLLEPERARGESGRLLVTRPPGYELRVEPGRLDLHRFEAAVRDARAVASAGRPDAAGELLRRALALWRGPPLADVVVEGPVRAEVARLEELRLRSLEDFVDAELGTGRHAEVIGDLERMAAQHPLRERVRGQLMVALYRSGRQAEALAVYRDTRRALVDELGIEPGRELQELERAVLAHDPALDPPRAAGGTQAPSVEGLVGRARELAEVGSWLERALEGHGGVVLVGGEPGIGKSRLAEAVAASAHASGARVLVGRCWEAGGAPSYWPWVQALRPYLRETDAQALRSQVGSAAAELGALLPDLRERLGGETPPPTADAEGARFRLFEAVAAFLARAAASRPLVLVLDDLHAADAPSLLLLQFVAAQAVHAPILLLGCYRDTEVRPDLGQALAGLSREPAVHRLGLQGLGRAETSRLLELTMGSAPPEELAARVHADTRGNPLFATEIGRLLAAGGPRAGARTGGTLPIPEGVREAIGERIAHRSPACRDALALASVAGREFSLDALVRIGGLAEDELFAALEEAAAARLVGDVPGTSGRMRFSHILIRDALYEGLPATRRLRLHRGIGDALETLYDANTEPHVAELAYHYALAGSGAAPKAIAYTVRAGDRAASQLAHEEAARHYTAALGLLESIGSEAAPQTCDVLLALGDALSRSGSLGEAKDAFRRAAGLAGRGGWPDRLARAALGYGGRFVWARAGSDAELVPLLQRALQAVGEEDSPDRVRILSRLAGALRDDRSGERRTAYAREAVAIARRLGDPGTLAYALDGHWPAVEGPATVRERIARADELIAIAEAIGDTERAFQGHDYRLHTLWALGDRAGVELELDRLDALAAKLRQAPHRWHAAASRTALVLQDGRFAEAETEIARTLELGRRAQCWNAVVSERLALFVLRREQGRLAEVEATLRRSVHEYPALWRFEAALAHCLAGLGREREARPALDALLGRDLAHEHFDEEWLFGMNTLVGAAAALDDLEAAARLHELLLPYERLYSEAPIEATFGSVALWLGVLATTLRRFGEAERHFAVALGVERGMGARPWAAHVRHEHGAMLRARGGPGDDAAADELLDEAVAGYRELGMEHWAARAAGLASPGPALSRPSRRAAR